MTLDPRIGEWLEQSYRSAVDVQIGGRQLTVLLETPAGADGDDPVATIVGALRAAGSAAVGVITEGGGRYGIGRVLVQRSLVRIALRKEHPDLADRIGAKWFDPDTDPAVRHWAERLGIELA